MPTSQSIYLISSSVPRALIKVCGNGSHGWSVAMDAALGQRCTQKKNPKNAVFLPISATLRSLLGINGQPGCPLHPCPCFHFIPNYPECRPLPSSGCFILSLCAFLCNHLLFTCSFLPQTGFFLAMFSGKHGLWVLYINNYI